MEMTDSKILPLYKGEIDKDRNLLIKFMWSGKVVNGDDKND